MITRIEIISYEGINQELVTRITTWASEVLEKADLSYQPSFLCISIWKTLEELKTFYHKEKESLGVVTGEELDFLATHEAWRGYPRIHICEQRLTGLPDRVFQGTLHHEIGHALRHGTPEFYTFRFSESIQKAGVACGMNLQLLQQCIYLLSIAIKDADVDQWLGKIGLGFSQQALLEHLISETEEERRVWEMVRCYPAPRRIAIAAFLKTLLPIEAMVSAGIEGMKALRNRWYEAYEWLSKKEQETIFRLAWYAIEQAGNTFQERLEKTAFVLLTETSAE